jgi:hypothetical protein
MADNQMITCLEQKVILLTKVLDLTKQIQVRCKQPEIELDDFLEQRVPYMKRVQKCNDLISALTKQMPLEKQNRMTQLLNAEIIEKDCEEEELLILILSKNCRTIMSRIASLDKSANELIKKQYGAVREKLAELRKEGKKPTMLFHDG